jgi:hexosaminidase
VLSFSCPIFALEIQIKGKWLHLKPDQLFIMYRIAFFALVLFSQLFLQPLLAQHSIIPAPVEYTVGQGAFLFSAQTRLLANSNDEAALEQLINWFGSTLKDRGIEGSKQFTNTISFKLLSGTEKMGSDEGYRLTVSPEGILLTANAPSGIFYGMQTLLQMIPVEIKGGATTIQSCTITDYPRMGWRGLMLDVSRHFFTVDEVKQYIDLMSQYKFNVFHWHLTDDQGWRIEIKSFPKLATVGGCRVERFGTFGERIPPMAGEAATDCNFYTQEQIRDVVAYAKARNVTIVPEIDVPGHSLAAIAAYPELSITKEKQMVSPGHKFSEWFGNGTFKMLLDNTLNPADEKVYDFLDKVFGEVASLFPGTYIHAGGDEAYHGYWEKSAEVQAFMKKNDLKDVHAMQSYFMKRVAKVIESKGKKMIGWDEILDGGLAEGAAVMSWRGMKGGIAAAKQGHPVVMSPTTHAYIDYMQADPYWEPRVYDKLFLKTCYGFDPVPEGVDAKLILGGQANLWTEKVATFRHATYMTYPRAWAIAEALWTPVKNKNWDDFATRTEMHFDRANAAGIQVSHALYDPIVKAEVVKGDTMLHIRCEYPGAIIRFTIDGSHPDGFSPVYTKPLKLPAGPIVLRTATFKGGDKLGRTLVLSTEELLKRRSW